MPLCVWGSLSSRSVRGSVCVRQFSLFSTPSLQNVGWTNILSHHLFYLIALLHQGSHAPHHWWCAAYIFDIHWWHAPSLLSATPCLHLAAVVRNFRTTDSSSSSPSSKICLMCSLTFDLVVWYSSHICAWYRLYSGEMWLVFGEPCEFVRVVPWENWVKKTPAYGIGWSLL